MKHTKILFNCFAATLIIFSLNVVSAQNAKPDLSSPLVTIPSAQPTVFYEYTANKIYSINTGLGIATQIILDPSDKIKDFGTGFSTGWDIVRRDNVLYIKPKDPDAETNMYIKTERRSYLLDLKIVTKDWRKIDEAKNLGVAYLVQFNYKDVSPSLFDSLKRAPNINKVVRTPIVKNNNQTPKSLSESDFIKRPNKANYFSYHTDYEVAADSGSKWMIPVRVYDDGELTYVQMPINSNVPSFFGRHSDRGEEFLLNKTVKQDQFLLHGVYPFIIIRYGSDVVAVRRR
ncbi:MAG: VirB9 protein [Pseudomonadota bacterium]|jgi:type IV secretion system protein VirB9